MRHAFYLAWRYLRYHRLRSLALIACLSLMGALPLAVHALLDQGRQTMLDRAARTPLLAGPLGSGVDLTLNALYFTNPDMARTTMAEAERIESTGWAEALPVYSRFAVRGQPLVGVTLDYFEFRRLTTVRGEMMTILGQCVLGAEAARALGLGPGDTLLTTPGDLFDLAGMLPLKLHVTGVLGTRHSPDDNAIFVDLKTAWIMEGLGHGHAAPASVAMTGQGEGIGNRILDPGQITYTEITPENLASFHFHGAPASYPVSAVIAVPHDHRAATLLRGRYLRHEQEAQLVEPVAIVRNLLDSVFRVRDLFDAVLLVVGLATLLALALVFFLSMRLRRGEMDIMFLLGSSRLAMFQLVLAESLLLLTASTGIGMGLVGLARQVPVAMLLRFLLV